MRTLLFHTYHFPPIGGSGAQRPLKMARYLLDHGYRSTVVTGGGATNDRWAPEDRTLEQEVPDELDVLRVDASDEPPATDGRWRGRSVRWLGARSRWATWWVDGSVALAADGARSADLIYVWMQPYASAEAGARLSRMTGTPWVADLGDPWALDEMMAYPSALHRRREIGRMAQQLGGAAAIVMSTPEAAERLARDVPALAHIPIHAIGNGYDATDFEAPVARLADGTFRIVHTGYLHTELGRQFRETRALRRVLRGAVDGVDILTRSHVFLVEALDRLLARRPELRDVVELHLAGVLTEADLEVARTCPVVTLHGYVDHARSIELMRTADLLFLPMQTLPPGVRATIVPGKTYEYLAAGTPVLGAVPDGDARDMLAAAGNALLCRPDDVTGIAQALDDAVTRFLAGQAPPAATPGAVEPYEYRNLARRLAGVFDDALGAQ